MKRTPAPPMKLTPEQIGEVESAVFKLVEPQLDPRFYLLDVAFEKEAGYWYLRIYVEGRDFSISLSDCEVISRALDPLLDDYPPVRDLSYNLEVSSPGLFRPLKRAREFEFYAGRSVRIESQPAPGKSKKDSQAEPKTALKPQEGILQAFDSARNTVTLKKPDSTETFDVTLDDTLAVCLNPTIQFPEDDDTVPEII